MPRSLSSLAALLLCSSALAGCGTMGSINPFGPSGATADRTIVQQQVQAPASDIAGGVRQAHELRLAGKYDDASHILSQLMLVASDDPRVVGEYGKTLLQRGQLQDSVQFLSRAVQLQSGDWTTYSALGVAYDQIGDQASARSAYDHALALAPREASVLSNYALSRMLAGDMTQARALAVKAQAAGGDVDPKIARNIALIASTPEQPVAANAQPPLQTASGAPAPLVATAAPAPLANTAPAMPALRTAIAAPAPAAAPVATPAPAKTVAAAAPAPMVSAPSTPRILMHETASNSLPPGTQPFSGVVMQPVPVDPLAGPVKPRRAAKPVVSAPVAVAQAAKPAPVATPAKVASATPMPTKMVVPVIGPAPAKLVAAKPVEAVKAAAPVPAKPATAVADKTPATVKPVVAKQDGVPALRLAADASTP